MSVKSKNTNDKILLTVFIPDEFDIVEFVFNFFEATEDDDNKS